MKLTKVKLFAFILAILMIVSSLPLVANAATTTYSKSSNSGIRDEVCSALSPGAISYYTGNYEYADFIELSSSELKSTLSTLMRSTHTEITSYNDCRDFVWQTDCENNNTSRATTLYTDYQMQSSEWAGSWTCNREHVWPQSKGGGNTSGGGADLHHIRPEKASVNSSRGNKSFGTGSGMYVPPDNAKGDVARIVLYVYVRWGSDWGADSVTEVFQSVDLLLSWCALDPVDTWEMGRNEVVQNIQGNRNVFIDYPELAWQMFGKAAPSNMTTPSGAAENGNVPSNPPAGGDSGSTGGSTGGGTTTPSTPAEIPDSFVMKNKSSYVTATSKPYTSSSGTTKDQLAMSTSRSDAATFTLVKNNDNTLSFKVGNKFLYADGTHVRLVGSAGDNTKFIPEATSGGYFVKCANATYDNKPQYLEVYKESLCCFGMGSDTSIYVIVFESVSGGSTGGSTGGGTTGGTTGGNTGGTTGGNTGSGTTTPSTGALASFDLGANGGTTHKDGNEAAEGVKFTSGSYTITLSGVNKVYSGAIDAKGNSCLKIGTGSKVGGFSFTVGSDVKKVVIYVAQYKENATIVTINGSEHTISTASNNGEYTAITVDTSSNKTVTLETTSSGKRCMINTIELFGTSSGGSTGGNSGSTGGTTGGTTGGNTGGSTGGNTGTTTPSIPSGIPDSFVINNGGKYVTDTVYAYTSSSGSTKDELVMADSKSDAATFSVVKNSDGTVSFKVGGKFLFADGTNVRLVTSQDDNTKFVLEETSSGYFIKCAVANYQGKPQYLEVWSGYLTCFSKNENSDTSIFTFALEAVTGGNSGSTGGTDTPGTDTPGTDTPGTDTPGTDTPGTDTPGTDTPGTDTPGTDTPGTDTPGTDAPGTDAPGTDTPGTDAPEALPNGGVTQVDGIPEIPWPEDDRSSSTVTTVIIIISICAVGAFAAAAVIMIVKKKKK
ncbi:MAG: hypothetical protein E7626_07345 [Ruminococcaceae bacterium]|nr:hypothetical protein [Oscillospiraceae bacterium]